MSRVFEIGDIVCIGQPGPGAPTYRIVNLHPQYRGVKVPKTLEYLNSGGTFNPILEETTHKQWANIDFILVSGTDPGTTKSRKALLPLEIQILKQEKKFMESEISPKSIRNVLGFWQTLHKSTSPPNSKEWKNKLYEIHVQVSKHKLTAGVI